MVGGCEPNSSKIRAPGPSSGADLVAASPVLRAAGPFAIHQGKNHYQQ